jgi:hypothetical protein
MYVHDKQYNQLSYTQFAILNFRKFHYNLNMFPTTYTEDWNVQYWDFPNWIRNKFSVALAFRIYTSHFLAVDVSISWLVTQRAHTDVDMPRPTVQGVGTPCPHVDFYRITVQGPRGKSQGQRRWSSLLSHQRALGHV